MSAWHEDHNKARKIGADLRKSKLDRARWSRYEGTKRGKTTLNGVVKARLNNALHFFVPLEGQKHRNFLISYYEILTQQGYKRVLFNE